MAAEEKPGSVWWQAWSSWTIRTNTWGNKWGKCGCLFRATVTIVHGDVICGRRYSLNERLVFLLSMFISSVSWGDGAACGTEPSVWRRCPVHATLILNSDTGYQLMTLKHRLSWTYRRNSQSKAVIHYMGSNKAKKKRMLSEPTEPQRMPYLLHTGLPHKQTREGLDRHSSSMMRSALNLTVYWCSHADDTSIVCSIINNDESLHWEEINDHAESCTENNLLLNVRKSNKLSVYLRKKRAESVELSWS